MASNSSDSPSDDGHHFATPPRPVFRPSLFSRVAARWDDLRLQPWPAGDDADPGDPFILAAVGAMGPGIDPWRGGGGSRLVAPVAGTGSRRTPDASGPPPGVLVLVFVLGPADRGW